MASARAVPRGRLRLRARPGPSLLLAVVLVAWTVAPLVAIALRAHARGEVFTGADAPTMFDELQYFAWIRDASDHFLASNLFRIGSSEHVFADPVFLFSAALHRLGASIPLSYIALAPAAIASLALGPYAFARARLAAPWPAAAAAATGLFYLGPLFLALHWAGLLSTPHDITLAGAGFTQFPVDLLWGGLPFALAVGLVPAAFLLAERERALAAGITAAFVTWIHPWQGLQIAIACGAVLAVERRPSRALLAPIAGTALPLLYFAALARWDADWKLAHHQAHSTDVRAWALAVVLAPLVALALAGVRSPRDRRGEALLLAWPPACIAAFFVSPTVESHALIGLSLPLAILAVRGWQRLRWSRPLGAIAATTIVVAGSVYAGHTLHRAVSAGTQPYSIKPGERDALDFLDHAPASGGVLGRAYAGALVPAFAGRQTWVGHGTWTPQFVERAQLAERLVKGPSSPAAARAFVRATGARYVFADCAARPGLAGILAPLTAQTRRFGCAAVYVLR